MVSEDTPNLPMVIYNKSNYYLCNKARQHITSIFYCFDTFFFLPSGESASPPNLPFRSAPSIFCLDCPFHLAQSWSWRGEEEKLC